MESPEVLSTCYTEVHPGAPRQRVRIVFDVAEGPKKRVAATCSKQWMTLDDIWEHKKRGFQVEKNGTKLQ